MTVVINKMKVARDKAARARESLDAIVNQLDASISKLEAREERMNAKINEMAVYRESTPGLIKFNVRGKLFTVSKHNLLKFADSRFFHILSSHVLKPESNGAYFVDRRSIYWGHILNLLGGSAVNISGLDKEELAELDGELAHWSLPALKIPSKIANINSVLALHVCAMSNGDFVTFCSDGTMRRWTSTGLALKSTPTYVNESIAIAPFSDDIISIWTKTEFTMVQFSNSKNQSAVPPGFSFNRCLTKSLSVLTFLSFDQSFCVGLSNGNIRILTYASYLQRNSLIASQAPWYYEKTWKVPQGEKSTSLKMLLLSDQRIAVATTSHVYLLSSSLELERTIPLLSPYSLNVSRCLIEAPPLLETALGFLCTGSDDGYVFSWDVNTGAEIRRSYVHQDQQPIKVMIQLANGLLLTTKPSGAACIGGRPFKQEGFNTVVHLKHPAGVVENDQRNFVTWNAGTTKSIDIWRQNAEIIL